MRAKLDSNAQGVVWSYDGNASAAIASLAEQGMAGTVLVSGLDRTVQALQLILLGGQMQSGWRPLADMATPCPDDGAADRGRGLRGRGF